MAENSASVGVREFARQIGKSHTWVYKLIKAGKLPRNEDGTLPVNEAFAAYDKLTRGTESQPEELPDDDNAPMSPKMAKAQNVTEAFNKARAMEKTYQAKLKEIEFKLKQGDLVESAKVRQDAQATASALRARLMSIPVRVAGLCEGRTSREIEEILEGAIDDALKEFKKSEF